MSLKTNVGQEAGSLGAAAVAAVACGLWPDFGRIDQVHQLESTDRPDPACVAVYRQLLPLFDQARTAQARLGRTAGGTDGVTADREALTLAGFVCLGPLPRPARGLFRSFWRLIPERDKARSRIMSARGTLKSGDIAMRWTLALVTGLLLLLQTGYFVFLRTLLVCQLRSGKSFRQPLLGR